LDWGPWPRRKTGSSGPDINFSSNGELCSAICGPNTALRAMISEFDFKFRYKKQAITYVLSRFLIEV
jgi:hypothetical protein